MEPMNEHNSTHFSCTVLFCEVVTVILGTVFCLVFLHLEFEIVFDFQKPFHRIFFSWPLNTPAVLRPHPSIIIVIIVMITEND